MNIKEFKKRTKSRPRLRFSNKSYGGLPWEDWYKLAGVTNRISYGCNFFGDGSCVRSRRIEKEGGTPNKMCCCYRCVYELGYLDLVQDDPEVIERIAGYFLPKVGFWRKDKGCILPRKYRSATCLGYRCGDIGKYIIDGNAGILIAFVNAIRAHSLEGRQLYNLGKTLTNIDM